MSENSDELMQVAVEHHRGGRLAQAEEVYRRVVQIDRGNADAHHLLGVVVHQMGRHGDALPLVERAIEVRPTAVEFRVNLASILAALGRRDEAIAAARKAVEMNPGSAVAQFTCGKLLAGAGRLPEAAEFLGKAAEIQPDWVMAWSELGMVLKDLKRFGEAEGAFAKAVKLVPGAAPLRTNLANVLKEQERLDEALAEFREAARLRPEVPLVHYNLGGALVSKGKWEEAIAEYREAIRIQPGYATAYDGLGSALMGMGNCAGALKQFAAAVQLQPGDGDLHWSYGWNLLLCGDYEKGLREFEWRWKSAVYRDVRRRFVDRQWHGQDISGKRILVYSEGGLGDTIQFARYVPMLAQRGAKVILVCQAALVSLLRDLRGVERIVGFEGSATNFNAEESDVGKFDVACPMMSLPLNFGTTVETIPAQAPYVRADAERSARWMGKVANDSARMKVGLVWAGNPANQNDRKRSIALKVLAPLAEVKSVRFFSLQVGPGAAEAKSPPAGMELIDFSGELGDFADTAALIENLDLVISVDTSVAHLAGAMGKAVWMLVPFHPDWRWMVDREDSPWYPTMRLFRQERVGVWDGAIGRVAEALGTLAHKK